MPSTVNGCGTHYYGKKNVQKRPGPCPHCGGATELESYDTRLFVVFVFIPIFPLKRMRIIDYCPACTRHFAVEAHKWETAKQLEVSGAMEKFRTNPTPEAAMAAHQQLMNFHQLEEAAEFRRTMREKFADNAKVHAYLGTVLEHFGRLEDANGCYTRAFELRPDLPEARVGVARSCIRRQRREEARKLLDFLEKPGASQLYSLEPLETLARAYQNANQHDDALALLAVIQKELPKLSEEKWFRDLVAKSEKSSGRKDSQLPKLPFSWKRLFGPGQASTARTLLILGVLLATVVLGFVVSNEYIRRHRMLHIVNGYDQRANVRIQGVGDFNRIHQLESVPLAEGRYHAAISGPIQQEQDFEVRGNYWSRWFSDPVWVLNIGGEAILIQTAVVYSKNPRPPIVTIHDGKAFETYAEITHPFTELPESLRMKSHEQRTLVDLQVHKGSEADIFEYFVNQKQMDAALNFAERRLRSHPDDEYLLAQYLNTAAKRGQTNRSIAFLKAGLTNRPVQIEWHRAYQSLFRNPVQLPSLLADYDIWLQADPTNSALLYLRGRISGDRQRSQQYFERARQADSKNPYPIFALGYDRMAAGDWAAARPLFAQAVELAPKDRVFEHWLTLSRFALGEDAAIERETRPKLAHDPADAPTAIRLIDALVGQNKRTEVNQAGNAFANACNLKYGAQGSSLANAIRFHALYALGDFAELQKAVAAEKPGIAHRIRLQAMIEQGLVAEAAKGFASRQDDEEEGYRSLVALTLALAFSETGDKTEAARWLKQAQSSLENGSQEEVMAAQALGSFKAPTLADAQTLMVPPQLKAALLAAIILQHPEARAELATLARKLNVERVFPYHLIQRVTADRP